MLCNEQRNALIILGHGSRHAEGLKTVTQTAERLRERLGSMWVVDVAYMELAKPSLAMATAALLQQHRVGHLVIMPLFLSLGAHVSLQLPEAVRQLQEAYPEQSILVARHIGADPLLSDLVMGRIGELLSDNKEV